LAVTQAIRAISCTGAVLRVSRAVVLRLPILKTALSGRVRWLGLVALATLAGAFSADAPPEVTVSGLVGLLDAQTSLSVRAEDLRWAPSSGFLADRTIGRRLLFLGAETEGGPRDLYRARVRLGDAGQPLALGQLRNLTQTPIGDDAGLEVVGERASFATMAFGRLQAITVLELDGVRGEDKSNGWFSEVLRTLTYLQQTRTWLGVGRTDLVLQVPVQQAVFELGEQRLSVRLGASGREIEYDLKERRVRAKDGSQAHGVRVVPSRQPAKPFVLWAVDTVREEVGPEPIAWLEDKAFGIRDLVRRTAFNLTASKDERALKDTSEVVTAPTPALDATQLAQAREAWPPQNLPSLWKQVDPGEGEWAPVTLPFLRPSLALSTHETVPRYFYKTFTRPDPKRPYAKVWFVAMDMRQLDLNMQAGFEDPEPLTGPAGDGRLPDDKATVERVVATFNGAFKTEHGKYGMMVQKRVLLPPIVGGASVLVDTEHEVLFGSWPKTARIPENIVAFRQNLDPLVEDGVANPTGRQLWGWQLEGKSVLTERTALCVTPAGHLYYAWGEEIDGPTLGEALKQAGCRYGMHLDMNPGHCGLTFARVDDWQKHAFSLQRAVPKMSIPIDRHLRWSPKDFFYVTLRDPYPPESAKWHFTPDGGTQPSPVWWPGIFRGQAELTGASIEITSFERGRFDWAIRAGTHEHNEPGAPFMKTALSGEDSHRVLAAIGLAYATRATRLGLAFDGKASIPMRPKMGTLVIRPSEALSLVVDSVPTLGPQDSAVQLPLLVTRGEVTLEGRAQGPMRERAALCVTPGKRVLLARMKSDSPAALVSTLLALGCQDVVDLDRGSSDPSFLHRTGTDLPPTGDYETSVLYVLGRPMTPHAGRWELAASSLNAAPTGYDIPHRR
jgi:hypothetical protein